jgi:hypothetical protein
MTSGILLALLVGAAGVSLGYILQETRAKKKLDTAAGRAASILAEAESSAKEKNA